jgi:hypothetical protein
MIRAAPQPSTDGRGAQPTNPKPGDIRQLFGTVKALTHRVEVETDEEEQKRRRREESGKAFRMTAAAAVKPAKKIIARIPHKVYRRAERYLADTLDWFNLWNGDGHDLSSDFGNDMQPPNYPSLHL